MINSQVKCINTFHLAIGWPITWFTAVQQSNAVNGVVRRFFFSSTLKKLGDHCLLSVQHIPLGGFSVVGQHFGLSLCPKSVLLSRSGDTLVWYGEWCNTWHMVAGAWGSGGWAAWTRWHQPDVCGYDWEWLIENRQEIWTSNFRSFLLAKVL